MTGNEQFTIDNTFIELTISDFWKWSCSDLNDYTTISLLAKFIVASSLGVRCKSRSCDFITPDGIRVSTSCSSYVSSAEPDYPCNIIFPLVFSHCDVFIFCLLKKLYAWQSPLNLDFWEFYVLKASEPLLGARSITYNRLAKMQPLICDYRGIHDSIDSVYSRRVDVKKINSKEVIL